MSTNQQGTGERQLFRDSKLGNLVNGLVAAVAFAIVGWLGDIDWSSWPAWVGQLGAPAAGILAGLITSWRAKRTPAPARYER